jgi:hypothetical protein
MPERATARKRRGEKSAEAVVAAQKPAGSERKPGAGSFSEAKGRTKGRAKRP